MKKATNKNPLANCFNDLHESMAEDVNRGHIATFGKQRVIKDSFPGCR